MNVLIVGGGAREHVICEAIKKSENSTIFSVMSNKNPGIEKIAQQHIIEKETNIQAVIDFAKKHAIDIALIGPEAPLEAGLTDALEKEHIKVCAPSQKAARIETDKEWMRKLLKKYNILGQLKFQSFTDDKKAKDFIDSLNCEVVIKPIGLTGGKGVQVFEDHFSNIKQAHQYVKEVLEKKIGGQAKVLIEEKAIGEEFTLQAFADGTTILPLPLVQDHKRLQPGDKGPNTGGMGSYSSSDGLLPFLQKSDYEEAALILQQIIEALQSEGCPYIGPIYGQFMLTNDGPKIIEINARFGDPEAMNVLPLLKNDYLDICQAMIKGTLNKKKLDIKKQATVCKYIVPEGYGIKSLSGKIIFVDESKITQTGSLLFYASVNKENDHITTTSSRSLAVVGLSDTIQKAEQQCEQALQGISSDHIFIRHDIGTESLIQQRILHMKNIRGH